MKYVSNSRKVPGVGPAISACYDVEYFHKHAIHPTSCDDLGLYLDENEIRHHHFRFLGENNILGFARPSYDWFISIEGIAVAVPRKMLEGVTLKKDENLVFRHLAFYVAPHDCCFTSQKVGRCDVKFIEVVHTGPIIFDSIGFLS